MLPQWGGGRFGVARAAGSGAVLRGRVGNRRGRGWGSGRGRGRGRGRATAGGGRELEGGGEPREGESRRKGVEGVSRKEARERVAGPKSVCLSGQCTQGP